MLHPQTLPHPYRPYPGRAGPPAPEGPRPRVDVEAVRQRYPLEEIVPRFGIDLRGSGRALVGFCPFHDDRGTPNLNVFRDTASYYCFRCGAWGDVIGFVGRLLNIGFLAAVDRLTATPPVLPVRARRSPRVAPRDRGARDHECPPPRSPEEQACLSAAVEVYHRRLTVEEGALAYLAGRAVDRRQIDRYHVGYVTGGDLVPELHWRGLPPAAAERVGLLRADGSEVLAGRVVVPEFRAGRPVWMVGRAIAEEASGPKYLGLAGPKPLFGWEEARAAARAGEPVIAVEGVFDRFALLRWGLTGLAFVGTRVRPAAMEALKRFPRLYVALDADEGGREATLALTEVLRPRAIPVWLPPLPGVKDIDDLGQLPDGRDHFLRALESASLPAPAEETRAPQDAVAAPPEAVTTQGGHEPAAHHLTEGDEPMSASLNTVHLIGRVGCEPDMRYTGTGECRTKVRLATDRPVRPGSEPKTDWHDVVCWGQLGEFAGEYLDTGRLVYVAGRLAYRTYEVDGQTRKVAEIVAREVVPLDNRPARDAESAAEPDGFDSAMPGGHLQADAA